ncbi:MAG TPA: C-terminal binding protein [Agriterribacter sp.]|nr:C-terminal binding protein [Agriterribacter sp.]
MSKKVVITDYEFPNVDQEKDMLKKLGFEVDAGQCKTEDEVIELSRGAEGVFVQWAPVTGKVIGNLKNCKIIVRYGIGVDNVDLEVAKKKGIAVCNVPDYALQEVADHALSLALALGRQITEIDKLMRRGIWKFPPPLSLPPFREMTFTTMGYGRIAREVIKRAKAFGFKTAAFDPFIQPEIMKANGVVPVGKEEAFRGADILSLHLPLNDETYHVINRESFKQMKKSAILINTARGGLIDTEALIEALQDNKIAAAGLDVYEKEPLPGNYQLMEFKNVILTSHCAWYSSSAITSLQYKATQEMIRGLNGEKLKNKIV